MIAEHSRLGILVGGGPAPGINSVISSATIEAINSGLQVTGIYEGFEHLIKERKDQVRPLTIDDVSRIHLQGGSILRTSRANPTVHADDLRRTVQTIQELGITHLVTIGGDDTAYSAFCVAKALGGSVQVAHVPKTIDNDLPLPSGMPTFGFETARHIGAQSVMHLMEDARTTGRWYFVVVMGRKAGHLALGIGKAAGATVTVIPEEFSEKRISLSDVSNILEGAILKRRIIGRPDGVAVIAEGIGEKLDPEELAKIPGVEIERDPHGHIRLGEIPLAAIVRREIQRRFKQRGEKVTLGELTLGYELRCAPPIPFDIDYTRTLGYGAVRYLISGSHEERLQYGGMVCLEDGHLRTIPFAELRDPEGGRTRVRIVDIQSDHYRVACEYMIRLERSDLQDDKTKTELAKAAHMSSEEFQRRFASTVGLTY